MSDHSSQVPRLLYLASMLKIPMPRSLAKLIPQGDLINAVALKGLMGTSSEYQIAIEHLQGLAKAGAAGGPAHVDEFRTLICSIGLDLVETRREDMVQTDYLKAMKVITAFSEGEGVMIEHAEASLEGDEGGEDMVKWTSGFEPFDIAIGGHYHSVMTVQGKPGHGKTSVMCAHLAMAKLTGAADEVWFYESEIPLNLMLYKMRHYRKMKVFGAKDRMVCGLITMQEILEQAEADPNPNRIIYIDGPDVMAGGTGEGKRFAIESIYRDLLRLKNTCKQVVVSSQAKRGARTLDLESVSEAFAKAQYSDILIGVTRHGVVNSNKNLSSVNLFVAKNRFGVPDTNYNFNFNYDDLTYEVLDVTPEGRFEEEDW